MPCGVERFSDLNAVISAHEQPYDASGPFGGVPFLVKELSVGARRAVSQRFQGRLRVRRRSRMNSWRFRKAGLHLVRTTQTPEMGYNATTETVAFGPYTIHGRQATVPAVPVAVPALR